MAHEVTRLHGDQQLRWGDVAVFYRTNAQSRALEEAMVRAEVPYKVVGGTRFYDRREVKDVMAYLRVLVNPDDEVSWRRIVNVPKRGVGETSVAKLAGWSGLHGRVVRRGGGPCRRSRDVRQGGGGPAPAGVPARRLAPADGHPGAGGRERGRHRPRTRAGSLSGGHTRSDSATAAPPTVEPAGEPGRPGTARAGRAGVGGCRADRVPERAPGRGDHRGTGPGGERRRAGRGGGESTAPWPSSSRPPRWWPTPTSSRATGPRSR